MDSTRAGLTTDKFIFEENISENAIIRGYLIMKRTVTNLQLALTNGDAVLVPTGKFGDIVGVGSGGTGGTSERAINVASAWDGSTFAIPLSQSALYFRNVSDGVTSLNLSLLVADDSTSKSRSVTVTINNTSNLSEITSINFTGGTWKFKNGTQPTKLAAGHIATLTVYNDSNTEVLS